MPEVRLRAVRADDLDALGTPRTPEADPFEFFGFQATNGLAQRFAANGLITDDFGLIAVDDSDGQLVGHVGWFAVRHGPASRRVRSTSASPCWSSTEGAATAPRPRPRWPITCSRTRWSNGSKPPPMSTTWPSSGL